MSISIAFGKPIYTKILNTDTKKIVSIVEEYDFKEAGYGTAINDSESITSMSSKINVLEDTKLEFLKDLLLEEFYIFSRNEMKYPNEFRITTSWFTRSKRGESSNYHNHNNSMYSGVFYIQSELNSGDIEFTDYSNHRWLLESTEYNALNSQLWQYKPTPNMLLIFPSEMYHRIAKNNGEHIRYSLAFNLIPTGVIGSESADSHYIT